MEYILCIDLGTFCDNVLMKNAMHELKHKYKIVYLTDSKNNVSDDYIKVSFETPKFFTQDEKIKVADTHRNFFVWSLTHLDDAYRALLWSLSIKKKIKRLLKQYNFKNISILYPGLGTVWLLPKNLNIEVNILYYSPGILCYNIPWIFDSILKKPSYKLYAKKNYDYNKNSGINYLNRVAMLSNSDETVHETMSKLNHIICWDKSVVPKLDLVYKDNNVQYAGALISNDIKNTKPAFNDDLNAFIKSKKSIIYITFGTYGNSEELNKVLPKLIKLLGIYCEENNYGVIYHASNDKYQNISWLYKVNGFLKYEEVVPLCKLVIFTGSVCLQNICLYNATPMLMIPILVEQYFWSKNYKHFTGVQFIRTSSRFKFTMNDLKKALKVNPYLKKVSKSMKNNDAAANIAKLI